MEIVIMLFVLVGSSIAFSVWKKRKSPDSFRSVDGHDVPDSGLSLRKCLTCGHQGEMKTWLSNYNTPRFLVIAGFMLGYIPGLIFMALYWGKYKCPSCGGVGKNQSVKDVETATKEEVD